MSKWFYLICTIAFALIATCTIQTFGMEQGCSILAAMLVASLLPHVVSRRCNWWSPLCSQVLTVISLILIASAIHYIWAKTLQCGATLEMPQLLSDDRGYYKWALHHYDGRCNEPRATFIGFSLVMLGLWKLLGVSIVWPVAFNLMLTLTAIIMCGSMAVKFTRKRTSMAAPAAGALAMSLLSLHGYFMSQGFVLLKEALVYVAISMVALSFINLQNNDSTPRHSAINIALYTAACCILALVRAKYINFVALGIPLLAMSHMRNRTWKISTIIVVTIITWYMGMYFSPTYNITKQINNVVGGETMTQVMSSDQSLHVNYLALMDGYFFLPVWKKILFLPFTCGTQFIIPFPWNISIASWEGIMPRIRLGWYMCGGLMLFYYCWIAWHRKESLGTITWWPLISFVAISYITAGSVSRYILAFQPIFVAIAIYIIALAKDNLHKTPLKIFYSAYLTLLLTALVISYNLS